MVDIIKRLEQQDERLNKIESLLSAQKKVLNIDEVCLFTGLSKSHIYKNTCYHKMPFYKQSKHLFFDREEIEDWLKENRYKTTDEIDKEATSYVTLNKKGVAK